MYELNTYQNCKYGISVTWGTNETDTCPKAGENKLCWGWGEMEASWQHPGVMIQLTGTLAHIITTKTILCLHLQKHRK